MRSELNLEAIDVDGAVAESAHNAVEGLQSGDTRADFLKKAGLAGGAAVGGGALLGLLAPSGAMAAGGRPPAGVFGKGDIGILNYALTLEYLESAFYNEATANQASTGFIKNAQTQAALKRVTLDENAHVKLLRAGLGGKAVKAPKVDFGDTTSNEAMFTATAFALENEGVHAYHGQLLNIEAAKYVKTAAQIATVEARHASVFGLILQGTPDSISPDGPLDVPFKAKRVLKDVNKLGFIQK